MVSLLEGKATLTEGRIDDELPEEAIAETVRHIGIVLAQVAVYEGLLERLVFRV